MTMNDTIATNDAQRAERMRDELVAAIRERDELRYRLDALIDELAALAALRKRIEDSPTVVLHYAGGHWHDAPTAVMAQARIPDESWCGKPVKILVENDDV